MNGSLRYFLYIVVVVLIGVILMMFVDRFVPTDQKAVLFGLAVTIITVGVGQLILFLKAQDTLIKTQEVSNETKEVSRKADEVSRKADEAAQKATVAVEAAKDTHKLVNSQSEEAKKYLTQLAEMTGKIKYYEGIIEGATKAHTEEERRKLEAALAATPPVSIQPVVDLGKVAETLIPKLPDKIPDK
jgi:low affinity Fe/Cu permease